MTTMTSGVWSPHVPPSSRLTIDIDIDNRIEVTRARI